MIEEGDRTYFYVEARVVNIHNTARFEQTIFTRKIGPEILLTAKQLAECSDDPYVKDGQRFLGENDSAD